MVGESTWAKFVCDHPGCSRSYVRKEHLKRHSLIHEKGRFACHQCQRTFTRNDLLHAHLQRHQGHCNRRTSLSHSQDTGSTTQIQGNDNQQLPTGWEGSTQSSTSYLPQSVGLRNADFSSVTTEIHDFTTSASPTGCASDGSYISGSNDETSGSVPPWLFGQLGLFALQPEDYLTFSSGCDFDFDLGEPSQAQSTDLGTAQCIIATVARETFVQSDLERLWEQVSLSSVGPLDGIEAFDHSFKTLLDYCDCFIPIFHRPTLEISAMSPLLVLTMCHAGLLLDLNLDHMNWSRALHQELSQKAMQAAISSPKVELWLLQTLVILQHVGVYCLSGYEHEMAMIMHNLVVTLTRQNNIMGESQSGGVKSVPSSHLKWLEWAQRESTVRLAHAIFVSDVQYLIHFSHHANLSVTMMKRPLPCPSSIWEASTVTEWEAHMALEKHSRRQHGHGLHFLVEHLLTVRDSEFKRGAWYRLEATNPLSCYILIHGLAAAIAEEKYRTVQSAASTATKVLKNLDFENGLRLWRSSFGRIASEHRQSPLACNAKLMYHFATILIRNAISDFQMAAGSAFAFGRVTTAQRSQGAYNRLSSTDPLCQESYLHGLAIIQNGLQIHEVPSFHENIESEKSVEIIPKKAPVPAWQVYCAFLGVLIVWTRVVSLESLGPLRADQSAESRRSYMLCDFMVDNEDGELNRGHMGNWRASSDQVPITMLHRELCDSESAVAIDSARGNLHTVLGLVRNRLRGNRWYVASEATRMLQILSKARR